MKTDESGIVQMLQEKIAEHEEKIASFRQAINALMSGQMGSESPASSPSGTRGRRGRKKGSKNRVSAVSYSASNNLQGKATKRRGRRPGSSNATKGSAAAGKRTRRPRSGETMEGWVLRQLNDGVPKSNRTLMERYNKETGKKLEMNGFAARIAMIKKKGNLRSVKNPGDGITYTGKKEWFDNGKLRNEFISKIK